MAVKLDELLNHSSSQGGDLGYAVKDTVKAFKFLAVSVLKTTA